MYDINHDETIAYNEMLGIVQSVYKMVGHMIELAEDENTPEKVRFDQLFPRPGCVLTKKDLGDWLFRE